MSFVLPLEIGYFGPETGVDLSVRVQVPIAQQAILDAGGSLPEPCGTERRQQLVVASMNSPSIPETLGFLGNAPVCLHKSGFLVTTIRHGPLEPMGLFLSTMCREYGCEIFSPNDNAIVTDEILGRFETKSGKTLPE